MASRDPKLSVVIPAYNEEKRIQTGLADVLAYLGKQGYGWEVVVVDDGSLDRTADLVEEAAKDHPGLRLVKLQRNQGKGAAVRAGMLASKGDVVVFSDADGSTSLTEMERFWPLFGQGFDVIIGSRAVNRALIKVRQPWYRESMGKIFNVLVRSLGLSGFKDTQCGFKAFSRRAVEGIFPRMRVSRFGFDVEALVIARNLGYRVAELPVSWVNSPEAKVNPMTDAPRMFWDVLLIWYRDKMGYYKE